jgi:hypothetical protein
MQVDPSSLVITLPIRKKGKFTAVTEAHKNVLELHVR